MPWSSPELTHRKKASFSALFWRDYTIGELCCSSRHIPHCRHPSARTIQWRDWWYVPIPGCPGVELRGVRDGYLLTFHMNAFRCRVFHCKAHPLVAQTWQGPFPWFVGRVYVYSQQVTDVRWRASFIEWGFISRDNSYFFYLFELDLFEFQHQWHFVHMKINLISTIIRTQNMLSKTNVGEQILYTSALPKMHAN